MNNKHKSKIEINKEFKPDKKLKKLYNLYLIIVWIAAFYIWLIPSMVYLYGYSFEIFMILLIVTICITLVLIGFLLWIPKFYKTMVYKITENEIEYNSGVWLKTIAMIPYHQITNIIVSQGPIARKFNFSALKIQTAGFSGSSRPEITISGINEYDELREIIMNYVRDKKQTEIKPIEQESVNEKILNELIEIKKVLEKSN